MKHFLNNYFDEIYVINLKRRPDRLIKVAKKFNDLGININVVEAIDGADPSIEQSYNEYLDIPIGLEDAHPLELAYKKKMIDSKGAWAYLLTYKKILEQARVNNYNRILCFDDDIIFHQNFNEIIEERVSEIKEDWKLLCLGATQHQWRIPQTICYNNSNKLEYDPSEKYYHPLFTDGSFAVGIDHSVYDVLLDQVNKMNCSFDSGPLRKIMQLHQKDCYVLQPNLVIADVTESDIRGGRDQEVLSEKLKWNLEDYNTTHQYDLVSVIMPAYNAEATIVNSVKSILNQNYPALELIICDDGSTDETVEKLQKEFGHNPKVQILTNTENRGCYYVRNDAIRQAKGKFIAIQDADDYSLKERLNYQIIPFYTKNISVSIAKILRSHVQPSEAENLNEKELIELAGIRRNHLNRYGNYEYCCRNILGFMTTVYDKKVFDEIGLFWEDKHSMDMEYLERLWIHKKGKFFNEEDNAHQILTNTKYIPEFYYRVDTPVLYSFEMQGTNITNSFKTRKGNTLKTLWRKRHKNLVDYKYPQLNNNILVLNSDDFEERQNYLLQKIALQNESILSAQKEEIALLKKQLKSKSVKMIEEPKSHRSNNNHLHEKISDLKLTIKHLRNNITDLIDGNQKDREAIDWLENEVKHVSKWGHEEIENTRTYFKKNFYLIKKLKK